MQRSCCNLGWWASSICRYSAEIRRIDCCNGHTRFCVFMSVNKWDVLFCCVKPGGIPKPGTITTIKQELSETRTLRQPRCQSDKPGVLYATHSCLGLRWVTTTPQAPPGHGNWMTIIPWDFIDRPLGFPDGPVSSGQSHVELDKLCCTSSPNWCGAASLEEWFMGETGGSWSI